MDARFENEDNPKIINYVYKTDGKNSKCSCSGFGWAYQPVDGRIEYTTNQ